MNLQTYDTIRKGSPEAARTALSCLCEEFEKSPPRFQVDKAIVNGLLPILVAQVDHTQSIDAIVILTLISAGCKRHTEAVIDAGAIPVLIDSFETGGDRVKEQCLLALGTLANYAPSAAQHIFAHMDVSRYLHWSETLPPSDQVIWALGNLYRWEWPHLQGNLMVLEIMFTCMESDHSMVKCRALEALSKWVSQNPTSYLLDCICDRAHALSLAITHVDTSVRHFGLVLWGDLLSETSKQQSRKVCQTYMHAVSRLVSMERQPEDYANEMYYVYWALSNLVLDAPDVLDPLGAWVQLLCLDMLEIEQPMTKAMATEAVWVLRHVVQQCTDTQLITWICTADSVCQLVCWWKDALFDESESRNKCVQMLHILTVVLQTLSNHPAFFLHMNANHALHRVLEHMEDTIEEQTLVRVARHLLGVIELEPVPMETDPFGLELAKECFPVTAVGAAAA